MHCLDSPVPSPVWTMIQRSTVPSVCVPGACVESEALANIIDRRKETAYTQEISHENVGKKNQEMPEEASSKAKKLAKR